MFLSNIFLTEGFNDPGIFKAVFVAGPPGSGKDTVIRQLGLLGSGLKKSDIDVAYSYLTRTNKLLSKAESLAPHYEQSAELIRKQNALWTRGFLGLIINTTGQDFTGTLSLDNELQRLGYETFMVFVDVDKDLAQARIAHRKTNPQSSTDNRDVENDYFQRAYEKSKSNVDFYSLVYGNQNFAHITNNVPLAEDDGAETPEQQFNRTLAQAGKKIRAFLRRPLSDRAQEIIALSNPPRR